jgi:hypothetical protein
VQLGDLGRVLLAPAEVDSEVRGELGRALLGDGHPLLLRVSVGVSIRDRDRDRDRDRAEQRAEQRAELRVELRVERRVELGLS